MFRKDESHQRDRRSGRHQKIFKHLCVWEVKPRPPPKATGQTKIAEFSIGQEIVAGRINHPTPVLPYQGEQDLLVRLKDLDRCRFIFTHEAAISSQNRTKDSL
jgi:hypothetical protein